MSQWFKPTSEQITMWDKWVEDNPEVAQVANRFKPWNLYRLKTTGQLVTLQSFNEDGTVTVNVSFKFNQHRIQPDFSVFGINPDDLEDCSLPHGVVEEDGQDILDASREV